MTVETPEAPEAEAVIQEAVQEAALPDFVTNAAATIVRTNGAAFVVEKQSDWAFANELGCVWAVGIWFVDGQVSDTQEIFHPLNGVDFIHVNRNNGVEDDETVVLESAESEAPADDTVVHVDFGGKAEAGEDEGDEAPPTA